MVFSGPSEIIPQSECAPEQVQNANLGLTSIMLPKQKLRRMGRVGVPRLTREEVVDAMIEAWEELDPQLGANAWVAVKLMPDKMAQEKNRTPKEAFADIRRLDWPWQMVSN